jgi:hypothetical protein
MIVRVVAVLCRAGGSIVRQISDDLIHLGIA